MWSFLVWTSQDIYLDNIRHGEDDIVLNVMDTPPPHLLVRVYSAPDLICSHTGQSHQPNHTGNVFLQ